jgi:hypothetical protein
MMHNLGNFLLNIPIGTKVYLGAPAKPMPIEISEAIGHLACTLPEVIEAHLPQCYIPDMMEAPAQVLVLILSSKTNLESILRSITVRLPDILPPGMPLDVLPFLADNQLVSNVRAAQCRVFASADDSRPS